MKILWIMKKYLDLAVDKSARIEMLRSLRRLGHEPRLLTGFRHTRGDYGLPGAIAYVPSLKARGLNHATFFAGTGVLLGRQLAEWHPDVVLMDAHTCLAGWPWHAARRRGRLDTAFVLDVRTVPVECRGALGRMEERLFGLSLRYARRWMDGITVISPFMRQTLAEQFGLDPARVGVWSSGVSLEHFDPERFTAAETAALRRELGLEGRCVLLYHGTLEPHRGVGTAIRALGALGERAADAALLVVGRGSALPELRREAIRLGVAERVVFRDPVPYDEIPRYVAAADAGLLPLPNLMWWRVSSPIKLMEFLAMGKPALVTDIEAHRDLLGDAAFAFYAGPGDADGLAEGLVRLRDALHGGRTPLAAEARSFAASSLSWDRQAERLSDYLSGLRTTSSPSPTTAGRSAGGPSGIKGRGRHSRAHRATGCAEHPGSERGHEDDVRHSTGSAAGLRG